MVKVTDFLEQILKVDDNSTSKQKLIVCLAEICGTAILVFMGCLSTVEGIIEDHGIIRVGFSFGLSVMIAVQVSCIL